MIRKQNVGLPPIRDVRAYLYRAFLRKVAAQRKAEIRSEGAFEDYFRLAEELSFEKKTETRLLLRQILSRSDRETAWIIWERIEGRSWDEISYDAAITNDAARLRYSRALREIREVFKINSRRYTEKLPQPARERHRKARLATLIESLLALRLFRALRAKPVFGVRLRIADHSREELLADVDRMFS